VFPDDLPSLFPDREIEFAIKLVENTKPIFMTPYRMVPVELNEFKMKLQDLIGRGFILSNVSPWGASVLFAKKDKTMRLCIDYK